MELSCLAATLERDELARAARLRFERDRARFIVGRAHLRRLLSRYLGVQPHQVRLEYSARGKPRLANPAIPLRFNVTHSGPRALIGIALNEIGVDLEQIRLVPELEAISGEVFTEREGKWILEVDGAERTSRFFSCWTRKEAFVKATGEGLSVDLRAFEATVAPDMSVVIRRPSGTHALEGWTLFAPEVSTDFMAAVAVRHPAARLTLHDARVWFQFKSSAAGRSVL